MKAADRQSGPLAFAPDEAAGTPNAGLSVRAALRAGRSPHCDAVVEAPFGAVGICAEHDRITGLVFLPPGNAPKRGHTALLERACAQIRAYLDDPMAPFDLPLAPVGTEFQRRVWAEIAAIAPGQTRRYGEIAARLRTAARAVGQACGDNRFPLVIACHRVVAVSGQGGFAHASRGFHTGVKQWLLQHERR